MFATVKAHLLTNEVVQGTPVLKAVLEEARSGRPVISYEGKMWVFQPVEDITHTFTPDELREFKEAYAEAEDPKNHLTDDEMMQLLEQELENE